MKDLPWVFVFCFFKKYLFTYVAVLGLSCGMQALPCGALALVCTGSVVVARTGFVAPWHVGS